MNEPASIQHFDRLREKMVEEQLKSRGITDKGVLEVFRTVPRHLFVEEKYRAMAYDDSPLPIDHDQTISQPFIVAYMTARLELSADDSVLEIGTGSGYQTAVLAELARLVYSIEILPDLMKTAEDNLGNMGYTNIRTKGGDGYGGWPDFAPFDAIILTAAPPGEVPEPLLEQLNENGRLIAPIGQEFQQLLMFTKKGAELIQKNLIAVRFVPMTGKAQK